mgnify:CR=1 FL=1
MNKVLRSVPLQPEREMVKALHSPSTETWTLGDGGKSLTVTCS